MQPWTYVIILLSLTLPTFHYEGARILCGLSAYHAICIYIYIYIYSVLHRSGLVGNSHDIYHIPILSLEIQS